MKIKQRINLRMLNVLLLFLTCMSLTGCGIGETFAAVGNFLKTLFGLVFLVPGMIMCIVAAIGIAPNYLSGTRGTNAVTRTTRDAVMNAKLQSKYAMLAVSIPLVGIGGFIVLGLAGLLLLIIPIGLMVIIVVLRMKSNKDKQRVKDTRVVTKAAAKVTGEVAKPVGIAAAAAAAPATGGASLAVAGAVVAGSTAIGEVAKDAAKNMKDVEVEGFEMTDTKQTLQMVGDQNLLLERAAHLGIPVENRTIEEVAGEIISLAPPAILKGLPDNMSDGDKAFQILSAFQQPQTQQQAPPDKGGVA